MTAPIVQTHSGIWVVRDDLHPGGTKGAEGIRLKDADKRLVEYGDIRFANEARDRLSVINDTDVAPANLVSMRSAACPKPARILKMANWSWTTISASVQSGR